MTEIRLLPPAGKYIKKIKDKNLKKKYQEALQLIQNDYTVGSEKMEIWPAYGVMTYSTIKQIMRLLIL